MPNGNNTPVTEENKREYVKLVCQMKMTGAIRKQLNAFLEGFYDIIPKKLVSIFTEQELELLISGLPTIDIDDLKANTEYHKYQPTSLQVSTTSTSPTLQVSTTSTSPTLQVSTTSTSPPLCRSVSEVLAHLCKSVPRVPAHLSAGQYQKY